MEKYSYDGEKFLSRLYNDMHLKQSVIHSSNVSDKKLEKIRKYLDRQERVHERAIEHGKLDLLKEFYYKKYVIEDVPDEYIDFLDKNQFDQIGHHLTEEQINEHKRIIIEGQKKSLSTWIDYLTSEDAKFYPWWARYWAFQGMLKIGAYDNENGIYGKRDSKTVAPFIELNREALAKAIDLVVKEVNGERIEDELDNLISQGSFTKLYQVLLKNQRNVQYDNDNTEGKWIKYDKGENYKPLWKSLQGYNTGWCTAGEIVCETQIENGDFYVYYTKDENGEIKIPRLAIRMDGKNRIGEIRGVAKGQNVEPHLEKVLEKKLEDFPDTKDYKKRLDDCEKLAYVYTKYKYNKDLTIDDLIFIYGVKEEIEGFGYEEDPRLSEIKENRDVIRDLNKIFKEKNSKFKDNDKANDGYKNLNLGWLKSAEGLEIPEIIRGDLDLFCLLSAENIKFPEIVEGSLYLDSLKSANGLKLPRTVKKLYLGSLETAGGLVLPEGLEELYLDGLRSAKGLRFPSTIKILDLSSLETAECLELPAGIDVLILPQGLELSNQKSQNQRKDR